jgi:hypothetical protein
MTTPAAHVEERKAYVVFAKLHADEEYRTRLADLYQTWQHFNEQYFHGQLLAPHLAIGRTAPRNLGHCAPTTDYGGKVQISLNAGLVFGDNRDWIVRPWPAEGTKRFIDDLLLRLSVRQFVLEVHATEEPGYAGFGPQFVKWANRIGEQLRLPSVVERRRARDDNKAVATGWPHCVRPDGFYGDDITDDALRLAGGCGEKRRLSMSPCHGVLQLMHYWLTAGKTDAALRMIEQQLKWGDALNGGRWPARKQVEAGLVDVDGSPLGEVVCDPGWLTWNGGVVRTIAERIHHFGSFAEMPVLADALEEAGCRDGRILRHLRERMEHHRGCWVLRLLLGTAKGELSK